MIAKEVLRRLQSVGSSLNCGARFLWAWKVEIDIGLWLLWVIRSYIKDRFFVVYGGSRVSQQLVVFLVIHFVSV